MVDGRFATIEIVAFLIRGLEKCLFGFNHSNSVAKTKLFFKEQSYVDTNCIFVRFLCRRPNGRVV